MPLQERFNRQAAALRDAPYMQALRAVLQTLQEAVQELQAAGFDAALEVRPLGVGQAQKYHAPIHANATLKIDNTALELIITNPPMKEELYIAFQTGMQDYQRLFDTANTAKLKDETIKHLLDIKARNDMVQGFAVAPRTRDDKPRLKMQP